MLWSRFRYNPNLIKSQIVQHDLVLDVINKINQDHQVMPTSRDDDYKFVIDPGGMMRMDNKYLSESFDGLKVSVKPEHIVSATIAWEKSHKYLEDLHEDVVRVFLSDLECVILRESTHSSILDWLTSMSELGKKESKSLRDCFYDTCVFNSVV